MKISMIGEACKHKEELIKQCAAELEIRELPAEAAYSAEYDPQIAGSDVVITQMCIRDRDNAGALSRQGL